MGDRFDFLNSHMNREEVSNLHNGAVTTYDYWFETPAFIAKQRCTIVNPGINAIEVGKGIHDYGDYGESIYWQERIILEVNDVDETIRLLNSMKYPVIMNVTRTRARINRCRITDVYDRYRSLMKRNYQIIDVSFDSDNQ